MKQHINRALLITIALLVHRGDWHAVRGRDDGQPRIQDHPGLQQARGPELVRAGQQVLDGRFPPSRVHQGRADGDPRQRPDRRCRMPAPSAWPCSSTARNTTGSTSSPAPRTSPIEIPLPGRVKMIDMWVWSGNFNYYLEAFVRDYRGVVYTIPMGDLNFVGWKNLRINIPDNMPQSKKYLPRREGLTLVKFRIWTQAERGRRHPGHRGRSRTSDKVGQVQLQQYQGSHRHLREPLRRRHPHQPGRLQGCPRRRREEIREARHEESHHRPARARGPFRPSLFAQAAARRSHHAPPPRPRPPTRRRRHSRRQQDRHRDRPAEAQGSLRGPVRGRRLLGRLDLLRRGSRHLAASSRAGPRAARPSPWPIPAMSAQDPKIVDKYVLGVKTEFYTRGYNEIFITAKRPIPIEGITKTISVWVAGRNYNHILWVELKDFFGNSFELPMGKLNFQGWKKLSVAIPPQNPDGRTGIVQRNFHYTSHMGLKIVGFRIECDPDEAFGTYYIYLDDLRAVTDLFAEDMPRYGRHARYMVSSPDSRATRGEVRGPGSKPSGRRRRTRCDREPSRRRALSISDEIGLVPLPRAGLPLQGPHRRRDSSRRRSPAPRRSATRATSSSSRARPPTASTS